MKIDPFTLEREQSIWENEVDFNLSESGVHPGTLKSLFGEELIQKLLNTELTYGFTQGSPSLRQAVAKIYRGARMENVQVFNGSAEANMLATFSLLESGDEIIYMIPNYLQIVGISKAIGVQIKTFSLKEELGWQPDLKQLKQLVSKKTKMICICNPNNPTGSVLTKQAIQEIGDIARETDAWILSDEVYRGAELDGKECFSCWDLNYPKTVVNGGLSKAYGLPGLRVGWSISNPDYIQQCWANHDYFSIAIGRLSDVIACHVLDPKNRIHTLNRTRKSLTKNLDLFQNWVNQFGDDLRFIPPKAGAMAFLHYKWPINSTKLVNRLREETSVLILPGDCYGMDHYLRFGYGAKQTQLNDALARLTPILKSL